MIFCPCLGAEIREATDGDDFRSSKDPDIFLVPGC